ncbi:MAG: hypothetical protein US35_C0030G0002 [Parcubacteria group bacterium GW2011_GWA2_37_10]|nr:MAG: hypothetical protein US35_C0030G0002 [Parcubacteria group bacterium GW2011_GWA2_37_10]
MQKEIILNWLDELANNNPQNYQEYFYDDTRNYVLQNENSSEKMKKLFECKDKKAVKKWLDDVCGYLATNLDTESLIHEYFQ